MGSGELKYYAKIALVSIVCALMSGFGVSAIKFVFELLYGHSAISSLVVAIDIFAFFFIGTFLVCSIGILVFVWRGTRRLGTSIDYLGNLPAAERHALESKIWKAAGWRSRKENQPRR